MAFYWHFMRQTNGLYLTMLATGLGVALIDTLMPVFIGRLVGLMTSANPAQASNLENAVDRLFFLGESHTSLLHRSIVANIRYGRPDATDAQVQQAAAQAHAHEFIAELRDWTGRTGYEAHAGERGVKLSGGQRQRVALARVVLKNAPILILDEATSALDSEIEAAIHEQLVTLMHGKTVIAIAHRLSTIARMDRLVVMDAGRIVEQGTHHALLALGGHYAKLWQRQSGGFLAEDLTDEPGGDLNNGKNGPVGSTKQAVALSSVHKQLFLL